MDLGRESLYGWGVCQLPMPRARKDIYADRRRGQMPVDFPDRRTARPLPSFAVVFSAILREDFPAAQAAIVSLSALLLLLILCLPIPSTPPQVLPPASEPIEIVTRLLKEPVSEPPVPIEPIVIQPLPEPLQPEPQPVAAKLPVVEQPAPKIVKIDSLPKAKTELLPRRVAKKTTQPAQRAVAMPKKTISMVTPRRQEPLVSVPTPARSADTFKTSNSDQPLVTVRPVLGKRSNEALVAARQAAPVADYRLKPGPSGQPAQVQGTRFVPTAQGTTVDLPASSGRRSDFSVPRSQGGHAVPTAGRSFAPQPGQARVEIAAVGQVAGSFSASSTQSAVPLPGKEVASFAGTASGADIDVPVASGRGVASGMVRPFGTATGNGPPDSAVNFIGDGEAGADPNLFISLNQLDACVDQSEEDRLRTELAIRLDSNVVYPCGEMKFDIRNVETGQTVWMRIYNPRDFADRCAALLSAIECINHSE